MNSSKGFLSLNLEGTVIRREDPTENESPNSEEASIEDGIANDGSDNTSKIREFKEEAKETTEDDRNACGKGGDGPKLPSGSAKMFGTTDDDSLSTSSEYSPEIERNVKNSKIAREQRFKRHHPGRRDNCESNASAVKETSRFPDFIRLYARKRITEETDKHLSKSDDQDRRQNIKRIIYHVSDTAIEKALIYTILEENEKLKEILSRERRHHVKEKSRIRQVLFAIDDALSGLPNRLGKIRIQNHKNLMKTNSFPPALRGCGEYQTVFESQPKTVWTIGEERDSDSSPMKLNVTTRTNITVDENIFSTTSTGSNGKFLQKMKSLNNLIEKLKKGQQTSIETVLRNELYAISLLKNEIKCTKQKIEQKSKTDSENSCISVTDVDQECCEACSFKNWNNGREIDLEDMKKLDKYVCLHKKTMNSLSLEVQRVKDFVNKEAKEKEEALMEKTNLHSEITKIRSAVRKKIREDIFGSERPKGYMGDVSSVNRPFRIIKDLKSQIEEKEKNLAAFKARLSRIEAAAQNKSTLLENERRKNAELERKLKIAATENNSHVVQLKSFKFINSELKKQMDVLKNQLEILLSQNAEFSCGNPYHVKNSLELTEAAKNEEIRMNQFRDEAEKKMKELENRLMKEMDSIKASYEKSEKMNDEYLRTFKTLLTTLYNYKYQKISKLRRKSSYGRAKETLGISKLEIQSLFNGNATEDTENQVDDLYQKCHSLIITGGECEFSVKLSAWLFDLIKNMMTDQNYHYLSD